MLPALVELLDGFGLGLGEVAEFAGVFFQIVEFPRGADSVGDPVCFCALDHGPVAFVFEKQGAGFGGRLSAQQGQQAAAFQRG